MYVTHNEPEGNNQFLLKDYNIINTFIKDADKGILPRIFAIIHFELPTFLIERNEARDTILLWMHMELG